MSFEEFDSTLKIWIETLHQYSLAQLCTKPSSHEWSMGQLYRHLIDDTNFYVTQMKACLSANDHQQEQADAFAKAIFLANAFPNTAIEGAPANAAIPQPQSKDQLVSELIEIKNEVKLLEPLLLGAMHLGKTKHPGLGYFTAHEWLQFAETHFRHHLRQKKRIDEFLKMNSSGEV